MRKTIQLCLSPPSSWTVGTSVDWMKAVGGVKYSYALELRDVGQHGFILPASQIRPTGEETWAAIYATAVELQSRVYTDSKACPALWKKN